MRLSVLDGDPGFATFQAMGGRFAKIEIHFNGERVQNVLTADTVAGIIVKHRLSENGKPVAVNGRIALEVLKGDVSIVHKVFGTLA